MEDFYVLVLNDSICESNLLPQFDDQWSMSSQVQRIQKFKSTKLTDDEYKRMKSCIDIMTSTEDYTEYKKAFDRFCYFCHVVPRGVIIRNYSIKKGKEKDHNTLSMEYAYNTRKISLDGDAKLYHMSKTDGITELNPYFRGKSERGYLYDKPRIYFTIKKNMTRLMADYKPTTKMHMYECKENIKYVYVDPLLPSKIFSGAVYVETTKPIKVEKINPKDKNISESCGIFDDIKFI